MAIVSVLVKDPSESVRDFNSRIAEVYSQEPITDIEMYVVDGEPMVKLVSEAEEATIDDVHAGLAEKEQDLILPQDAVAMGAAVSRIRARSEGRKSGAEKSEKHLLALMEPHGDAILDVEIKQGTRMEPLLDEQGNPMVSDVSGEVALAQQEATWALVTWALVADDEDAGEDDTDAASPAPEAEPPQSATAPVPAAPRTRPAAARPAAVVRAKATRISPDEIAS